MTPISVAIITNESNEMLIQTIESYSSVVDEVCVGVNGDHVNEDYIRAHTVKFSNVVLHKLNWDGYGPTKNNLQKLCKNDWILSVDADENASESLQHFLKHFQPLQDNLIYQFRLINHLGLQAIKFGAWGNGKKYYNRLFNRNVVTWNHAFVHEELSYKSEVQIVKGQGDILHFSASDIREVREKNWQYAQLSARVKHEKGRKTYFLKRYISAAYTFLKEFLVQLGFLDGVKGWQLAIENSRYSYNKYSFLYKMS